MKTFDIDQEFKALIATISHEETELLEASIKAEGCTTPLVTWEGTLIDGHNRYMICERNGIPYETRDVNAEHQVVSNRDEAIVWIIVNQLGRRNINNMCRAELVLRQKDILSKQARERQGKRNDLNIEQNSAQSSERAPQTRTILANQSSLSHDTINKVDYMLQRSSEEDRYTPEEITKIKTAVDNARKNRESVYGAWKKVKEITDAKQAVEDAKPGNFFRKYTEEEIAESEANVAKLRKDSEDKRNIEKRKEEARQLKIAGVTTTADYFAAKAIAELSQICKEDTGRAAAMQSVIDWIEQNK